ncbi:MULTISPECIES: DUF6612 family protein [Paenibacillus]|uniref:LppX_LprAFG lipoprotein n=1 Tax=Paenibacillus campinasensis TaxID=66347 RepID=A0A268EJ64_9BACL|nr:MULTISPECIES: DUF6612 family protein [Paenibacillus]MUG67930.1 hypothetical protein [Paenibacillus campinasensis]PAD73114.1 hypothetical protein CHH67_20940 [Paenibacillus campinasensis]PAK49680.1 hypothetical protein CHH75_20020 [Paenibacillus sp. 7541]
MKKWTALLLGAILAIGLTACGDAKKDEPTAAQTPSSEEQSTEPQETPVNEEEPKESELPTVDELIEKAAQASKEMKSFALAADIEQNFVVSHGEGQEEQSINMKLDSEVTIEPLEMKQNMVMSSPEGNMEMLQYITENGIYLQMDDEWMKIPEESEGEIRSSIEGVEQSAEQQVEQFKMIAQDTEITEEGDEYVLTADVSGNNLKDLAKSIMDQAGSDPQTEAMIEQMDIKSIKIVYSVNKESYLPMRSDVDMVLTMEAEGQSVELDMKMKSTYAQHNAINKIEVPQEALDAQ